MVGCNSISIAIHIRTGTPASGPLSFGVPNADACGRRDPGQLQADCERFPTALVASETLREFLRNSEHLTTDAEHGVADQMRAGLKAALMTSEAPALQNPAE